MRILISLIFLVFFGACALQAPTYLIAEDAATIIIQGDSRGLQQKKFLTYAKLDSTDLELKFKKKKWGYDLKVKGGAIKNRKKFRARLLSKQSEIDQVLSLLKNQTKQIRQVATVVNFKFSNQNQVWLLVEDFKDAFFEANKWRNGRILPSSELEVDDLQVGENKSWLNAKKELGSYKIPKALQVYENPITKEHTLFYDVFEISKDSILLDLHKKESAKALPDGIQRVANQYRLTTPTWRIYKKVVIPSDAKFVLLPGQTIVIEKEAELWIKGGAVWEGSAKDSIVVRGEKGNSGIVFMGGNVNLKHCSFSGIGISNIAPMERTGGVTIIGAALNIDRCKWQNSQAEDALNVVSCPSFKLMNNAFFNSSSDALDIDFSQGSIDGLTIVGAKDDGLDLCGSEVGSKNLVIEFCGDKGVSCGESSKWQADSIRLKSNRLGVVIKDNSQVKLNFLSITKSLIAAVVFNKKYYYGSASLTIENSLEVDTDKVMVEHGQSCWINGKSILPTAINFQKELKKLAESAQ